MVLFHNARLCRLTMEWTARSTDFAVVALCCRSNGKTGSIKPTGYVRESSTIYSSCQDLARGISSLSGSLGATSDWKQTGCVALDSRFASQATARPTLG